MPSSSSDRYLPRIEPVALGDQKAADGAQEYPLAEVNEVMTRLRLPAKAVAVARQQQVGHGELHGGGEHPS